MYSGALPLATLNYAQYAQVDYYLSATSNNGKTITKPMTAGQGGYYTFYLGHNPSVAVRETLEAKVGAFYPNPARQSATIALDLADGNAFSVRLVCRDGRVISLPDAAGKGDYRVDVSSLASGSYFVVFTNAAGQHVVRPLVVE
jgi:hypothetical protein